MENNPGKEESLGYFNLARGIGMIIILLGHSLTPFLGKTENGYPFYRWGSILGGGIMAMLFMISGFGFFKRDAKKCFRIQKKLLLRPYWFVALMILATKLILAIIEHRSFWRHGGELVLTYLLGLNAEGGGNLGGIPIESISIFWFILALFGGWNIYNAIAQLQSERLREVLVLGCVILGYILTLISKIWPFCLPMALMAVGYLAVGYFIRKHQLLSKKLPVWCWGIMLVIIASSVTFGEVNMVACVWRFGLIDVVGSFCAGFLLLRLYARIMKKNGNGRLESIIEEIGFNSIWILCIHAYEKNIFPWYRIPVIFSDHLLVGALVGITGRCVVIYLMYQVFVNISRKRKKKNKRVVLEETR